MEEEEEEEKEEEPKRGMAAIISFEAAKLSTYKTPGLCRKGSTSMAHNSVHCSVALNRSMGFYACLIRGASKRTMKETPKEDRRECSVTDK